MEVIPESIDYKEIGALLHQSEMFVKGGSLTQRHQWNHVANKDNPADAGTRGMSAEILHLSSWVKGHTS